MTFRVSMVTSQSACEGWRSWGSWNFQAPLSACLASAAGTQTQHWTLTASRVYQRHRVAPAELSQLSNYERTTHRLINPHTVEDRRRKTGRSATWGDTVIDTLAASYLAQPASVANTAAETAAKRKCDKYTALSLTSGSVCDVPVV